MTGDKRKKYIRTYLQCEQCSTIISIYRHHMRLKKPGHIKHIYCHVCRDRTPHIELREWELCSAHVN